MILTNLVYSIGKYVFLKSKGDFFNDQLKGLTIEYLTFLSDHVFYAIKKLWVLFPSI